jgi:hypothetical protein
MILMILIDFSSRCWSLCVFGSGPDARAHHRVETCRQLSGHRHQESIPQFRLSCWALDRLSAAEGAGGAFCSTSTAGRPTSKQSA